MAFITKPQKNEDQMVLENFILKKRETLLEARGKMRYKNM
jgi:hypothetical protein